MLHRYCDPTPVHPAMSTARLANGSAECPVPQASTIKLCPTAAAIQCTPQCKGDASKLAHAGATLLQLLPTVHLCKHSTSADTAEEVMHYSCNPREQKCNPNPHWKLKRSKFGHACHVSRGQALIQSIHGTCSRHAPKLHPPTQRLVQHRPQRKTRRTQRISKATLPAIAISATNRLASR